MVERAALDSSKS